MLRSRCQREPLPSEHQGIPTSTARRKSDYCPEPSKSRRLTGQKRLMPPRIHSPQFEASIQGRPYDSLIVWATCLSVRQDVKPCKSYPAAWPCQAIYRRFPPKFRFERRGYPLAIQGLSLRQNGRPAPNQVKSPELLQPARFGRPIQTSVPLFFGGKVWTFSRCQR